MTERQKRIDYLNSRIEKEKLVAGFIPRIEALVKKERKHLRRLKRWRPFLRDKSRIDSYIASSQKYLYHFLLRLEQYRKYAGF